jgi:hypothetical protein
MTLLYLALGLVCFVALAGLTEWVARTETDEGSER